MEKTTAAKKLQIIQSYLAALSYDVIAAQCEVSKGTVANIVSDFRAGQFPETAGVTDQIDLLRGLSQNLKRQGLTLGECSVGLLVLHRIRECGLEPADMERWPRILKSITDENEIEKFIRLVYSLEEAQQRTGLDPEALLDKVRDMEQKAAELEPLAQQVEDDRKEISGLARQREELTRETSNLENKYHLLNPRVGDLEKREAELTQRIQDQEKLTEEAAVTLKKMEKEKEKLLANGLSLEDLAKFNQRLSAIARKHGIQPAALKKRLLEELASLDKGLGLETLIQSRKAELKQAERNLVAIQQEIERLKSVTGSLEQEKNKLEASIEETREQVGQEIQRLIPAATDVVNHIIQELQQGCDEAVAEVQRVTEEAREIGTGIGRYQGIMETHTWLKYLLALVHGDAELSAPQVKIMLLSVLRGMAVWLKANDLDTVRYALLSIQIDNFLKELEKWPV